jgi:hypothetical protein
LAGITLLTNEQIEDGEFRALAEVSRVVQGAFSRDLDDALISGDGSDATPTGVLNIADEVSGPTLIAAIAVGEIGEAGGSPSYIALSPMTAAIESVTPDEFGNVLWTSLLEALSVTPVLIPALPQPFVYDPSQMYLLTSRDWQVDTSREYAPAYRNDATALRVSGRFNLAVPTPGRSVRKLNVGGAGGTEAASTAPATAAKATPTKRRDQAALASGHSWYYGREPRGHAFRACSGRCRCSHLRAASSRKPCDRRTSRAWARTSRCLSASSR